MKQWRILKSTEYRKAMDANIRKASQNTVNKIKKDIKKQNQAIKKMPPKKEETIRYVKESPFAGLKEIVDMKKNKAVVNELDSLIYEQEVQKKKRNTNNMSNNNNTQDRKPTPLEVIIATDPDRIKSMSTEDMVKLAMASGGGDPLSMIMALNMGKKGNNGNENDLQTKLLGMMMEKMFKGNNGDAQKSGGDMEMVKLMMQQNMQTQNMMMAMIAQKNEAPAEEGKNNLFMKELFSMVKGQTDFENTFLRDKIKELEFRQGSTDTLGEAKRMMDYFQTVKGLFGSGNQSPEAMKHELDMKSMENEKERLDREDAKRSTNMEQIGNMINNTIETFGSILGEPIAEAAKSKIEQFTEAANNPQPPPTKKVRISPEQYQNEIDLGDLNNLETELNNFERPKEKNKSKFTVYETG